MDVDYHLSTGACAQITQASTDDLEAWSMQPTVQFLSIKKLVNTSATNPDRYRLIISDGVHFVQAMLATQLNELVENDTIKKHTVAVLEKYTSNVVQNKRSVSMSASHIFEFTINFILVLLLSWGCEVWAKPARN